MNETDNVASLLSQPVPTKLTKVGQPQVSDLIQARRLEQGNARAIQDTRLAYMTYDDIADSEIYDPTDFHTVGNLIRNNVAKAITTRFPVTSDKYTLTIENLSYEKPKNRKLANEKDILKHEKSLMDKLSGEWVLYDTATGKELERKKATILNVPRMTQRGTFIRNGSELGLKHMFRLRPGIYARVKGDGTPSVHINPAQTTGRQMSLNMDQNTGVMAISRGTRTYGVLPLLKAAGVDDETIKEAWGEEVFNMNYNKYSRIVNNPGSEQYKEYKDLWETGFLPIKLDPETTLGTMGKSYSNMSAEVLLGASNKALKLSRTMSSEDEDDRDSLAYQRIMGPADYIPERIVRDGGGLLRKMFQRVLRDGNLSSIESGAFQPQVDSVFTEDKHAGYIDGASPFEGLDFASGVSRIGEGGIGDVKAAPAETRGVNDSYLGFIDPIRCFIPGTEIKVADDRVWVKVEELVEGDLVCAMSTTVDNCLSATYAPVSTIHRYEYHGDIYNYDDGVTAFAVTPEHRMWVTRDGDARPGIVACKDLFTEDYDTAYINLDDSYVEYADTIIDGDGWSTTAYVHKLQSSYMTVDHMDTTVYCPTVPGGLVFARLNGMAGFWVGQSPESLKVGLEVYLTYGVKKDSKGNLYTNFIDKTGKSGLRPMSITAKSIIATPEYYDPQADPEEFIPAFYKGKGIEYVQRKDVDFFLSSSNNMMSVGAGMIPNIGGIRSNRTLMGCLHPDTLVDIYRNGTVVTLPVRYYFTQFQPTDKIACLTDNYTDVELRNVRGVVQVPNYSRRLINISTAEVEGIARVTFRHKCLVKQSDGSITLKEAKDVKQGELIPVAKANSFDSLLQHKDKWCDVEWVEITSVTSEETEYDYVVDLDVNDSIYMLHSGVFTHNSKYPLQALSLKNREVPLVQREMTADGVKTTTEQVVAKQLGAKFAPATGTVVSVDDDEIVIKDREGNKHFIDLYNMYPANQKGFLHNTALVKPGDRVHQGDLLADSNYTDRGAAALGTNLKVAFMTGHGAELFEDAIAISESCAKKLASEQLHKFRGDLTSDTAYDKQRFLNLFGTEDYTTEQLEKIDENGMPKIGVKFQKGDPVFLGIQTRDLSTSGLSRNAAVPYVKTWEHDAEGTVVDVVKGRKHMTVYTRSFTPMQLGDKMCYDDKTEVMTKRGWLLFADLLADDEILTLDIRTGENYFTTFESAFKYRCEKEPMYRLTTKNLDIATTANHKHLVSAMNNSRYLDFQSSEQIYGKHRWFLTGCNLESAYSYKSSREDGAKERWEKYTGFVYCVTIPETHTMFVRRNGKTVWSGNSARYGSKGVVSTIIPDEEMPRDENGEIYDVLQSPLGLPSRLNPAQLGELQLSKVAKLTGRPVTVPDFIVDDTIDGYVSKQLKKYGLKDTSTVFDPRSNKHIEGIEDGYMFYYKLKHMSELKERGRGTGMYSSEEVPLKGEGAARRLGMMETSAVYSGGGMDVLRDAKLIRGQRNDEFWRDYRDGKHPDIPGTPLVHKKFFSHLVASGAHIERDQDGFRLSAATDEDLKELTQSRKVARAATFDSKNMQPIEGGLFDPAIFGADGDQWGYYELPEPVLNPLMFKPVASILGWSDTELREYLQGARNVDGKYGPEYVMDLLNNVDLKSELKKAKDLLKSGQGTLQQKDLARKRIRAISPLLRDEVKPTDLFFTRMPILPPRFRTVSVINGGETNIAADINFLYKRMMDAGDDLAAARKQLPGEFQVDARESYYNAINAVVGLMPTDDPKLESKGVGGLLKWAFGKGSPKLGSLHRKIFGSNLDMGGLGSIIPDSRLTIDQVGIPEESAWSMYEPFVVRELRQRGYSMVQAMKQVMDRTKEARTELEQVMKKRPVLLNRAPTLWRYGIQGMYPVIVEGRAIRVNPNVCKTYNADFDGDTVRTSIKIAISTKIFKTELDKSQNEAILYSSNNPNMEENMIKNASSIPLVNTRCAICDIPYIAESAKQLSDTVIEWDVPTGVFVESIDKCTGQKVVAPVTKLSKHLDVDMYDIQLSTYGAYKHIITVSKEGTLLTYKNGDIAITNAAESLGAVVPRAAKLDMGMDPKYCTKYINLGIQVPLTFEVGVFLGIMIGDGWVDANNTVRIAAECAEIQKRVLEITNPENTYLPVRKPSQLWEYDTERFGSDKQHRLTVYFSTLDAEILKGKIGKGAYNKHIPMESMAGSRAHRLGVLVGLLATDGSVNYSTTPAKGKKASQKSILFHTTSQLLRDNIIDLCNGLGIKATATPYKGANSLETCYAVNLSVRDTCRLYNSEPKFRMIANSDEEALSAMAAELQDDDSIDSYDIVPYPAALAHLITTYCGAILPASERNRYKKQGYISRDKASELVPNLLKFNVDDYNSFNKGLIKSPLTADEAMTMLHKWVAIVGNTDISWEVVTDVTYLGKMDGWDITVPGPLTFALGNGTFVQDSMTTHVPVSQTAIDAINKSMLPSRNLLSPQSFKAHFIPRDASNEGLYLASRVGKGTPIRFKTEEEAQAAYDRGEIRIDTPITIG